MQIRADTGKKYYLVDIILEMSINSNGFVHDVTVVTFSASNEFSQKNTHYMRVKILSS